MFSINAISPLGDATTVLFNDGERLSYYVSNLDNFADGYTNFEYSNNSGISVPIYLSTYKDNLSNLGFDVSDVDLINVEELNNIIHEISGRDLPLESWYDADPDYPPYEEGLSDYDVLGDINQYVGDQYSWLWNTSYWTKTLFGNVQSDNLESYHPIAYFVSTLGEICYSESSCFSGIPRAGIRPIITMDADDFDLNTFDINGTVRWIDDDNADNVRPTKSTIKLYRNGTLIDQTDVEKDDE